MKNKNIRLLGLILITLAACLGSFAQSISGDLSGTIFDASGATVPNATVVGKNDATGVEVTTKSTGTGEYHLGNWLKECSPGGEAQRLEAQKLCVNVIMYAMVGTYKLDAIHTDYIRQKMNTLNMKIPGQAK